MDNYQSTKIVEHSWVVFGPKAIPNPENKGFMNNPAFLITDKSVVVIDPGSSLQVGKAESWLATMKSLTEGAAEGTKAVIPPIALSDGQELKFDNITIKAHLNEIAHTRTDAIFEIFEDKVLITGDNSFNERMPRLDDGSFIGNMKAIDDALKLDVAVVVPCHGQAGGKDVLRGFRDFLSIIYDTSKTLRDEDIEAFEMKPVIVEKIEKFQKWESFDENIGKLISIAVLEAEKE